MRATALFVALLALGGCLGVGSPTPTGTPSGTPSASPSVSPTTSPTTDGTPTVSPTRGVHVLVRGSGALDRFRHVNVTVRSVVFSAGNQCHPVLVADEVTLTPTPMPDSDLDLDCVTYRLNRTVDLTAARSAVSLGAYLAPERMGERFLLVDGVEATYENGTTVEFADDDFVHRLGNAGSGVRRELVPVSVEKGRGAGGRYGWVVGAETPTASPEIAPSARYEVSVRGRVRPGNTVHVRVAGPDGPSTNRRVVVSGTRYRTNENGVVAVELDETEARYLRVEVRGNYSAS